MAIALLVIFLISTPIPTNLLGADVIHSPTEYSTVDPLSHTLQVDDEEELTALLHWFMDGASRNDRAVHEKFWNENLVYTSSAGSRFGKAEIMAGFDDTQNLREIGPTTQYSAHDITVRFFGEQRDVAVVSFRMKGETLTIQGTSVSWYLNSGTLIKLDGEWSVVNWHATRVP